MTRSQLPFVALDGSPLAGRELAMLIEAVVDDHLVLADTFMLRFILDIDETFERLRVKIGSTVEIKAGQLGESPDSKLIEGEVTSIEAVFDEGAQYVIVRGYDKSHRLHAGRKTRSFNNQTDSDIVKKVAGEAGDRDRNGRPVGNGPRARQPDQHDRLGVHPDAGPRDRLQRGRSRRRALVPRRRRRSDRRGRRRSSASAAS